jgi:hypothetical protein
MTDNHDQDSTVASLAGLAQGRRPVTYPPVKQATGWTLIGIAAWLTLGVLFAVVSVITGNTGRPGTDVSTGTALLAAVTLTVIAITLLRVGMRLLRKPDQ